MYIKFQDIKLSNDLEDVLRKFDIFEPENELNERINVLQQLNSLAKQWIIDLSIQRVCFYYLLAFNL